MPAADAILLPLCVGLSLLGLIGTGFAWRRGNKGRVLQGVALALAPVALYLSGLLRLLWNGVAAIGSWASRVVLSPAVWFGLSLLALCLVLWVVGGLVARRTPKKVKQKTVPTSGRTAGTPAAVRGPAGRAKTKAPVVDDDLAEIEALLKSRGID